MSVIDVKDLSIGYENKPVVEGINFEVNQGDYLCIVGENGAGKSTLVRTLLNLQKPISGTVIFEEEGIGYLPQQTVVQRDFPASVWEIVLSGNIAKLGWRVFYSHEEKERAEKNLKLLNMWDFKSKCYRNLSGGQQQRVLLARALCASDKVLFLDEPVSGLDPKVTAEFYQLTKELNQAGVTIIMVSHDLHAVLNLSTHILHIGKESIFYGKSEEYQASEMAKALGIDAEWEGQ